MTDVLFLVNEQSGRVREDGVAAVEAGLRTVLGGRAARFVVGDVPTLLRAAADDGAGTVATVGGDGTIGAVAAVLAGQAGRAFVPLPYGTANLIPRDLGMPLDPVSALERSLAAPVRQVDYATANDAPLLHSAVFGTFAEIAEEREKVREAEGLAGRIAALGAAAGALFGGEARTYRLVIDGVPVEATTNTVFVTLGAITGGDLGVPKRARIDEGELVVYVSDSLGPFGFLQRLIEAGTGGLAASDGIESRRCREAVVTSDGALVYSRDGEVEDCDRRVAFAVRPGALRVPDLRALTGAADTAEAQG